MNQVPRSKSTGRFLQENTGNQRNVEAVFRPEKFWTFFLSIPVHSNRNRPEVTRKISGRNTASTFCCFPAGTGHFSRSFPQVPAVSGGRNDRPGYMYYFLQITIILVHCLDQYSKVLIQENMSCFLKRCIYLVSQIFITLILKLFVHIRDLNHVSFISSFYLYNTLKNCSSRRLIANTTVENFTN